jgi:hypothetical protein
LQNNQKNNKNKIFKKNNEGALLLSEQPGHPLYLFCRRKKGCRSCPMRKPKKKKNRCCNCPAKQILGLKKASRAIHHSQFKGAGANWHIGTLLNWHIKKGAILRAAKAGPFALQGSLLLSLLQMF